MATTPDILPEAEIHAGNAPADYTELQLRAYRLGDLIKQSSLADDYVYWKQKVAQDEEAQRAVKRLAEAKEKFAECERFGRFHPDYHEALDRVYTAQAEVDRLESVRRFKQAEQSLDDLLHEISLILARAVSELVKVPDDGSGAKSGCGSGGSCSCGGCS